MSTGWRIWRYFTKEDIQMANKHMKRWSKSPVIREIRRPHPVLAWMWRNQTFNNRFGNSVLKTYTYHMTPLPASYVLPKKNVDLSPDKHFSKNVHTSFICNRQNLKIIQISINRWTDKLIMVYPHNIIFARQQKWTMNNWYTQDRWISKQSGQTKRRHIACFHFKLNSTKCKLIYSD